MGNTFQTRNERSEISWTMRKLSIPSVDPATGANAVSTPVFWSEDVRSTIAIGWIPENGVDFFTWFIVDLHKKWRVLFDDVDTHLRKNVNSPRVRLPVLVFTEYNDSGSSFFARKAELLSSSIISCSMRSNGAISAPFWRCISAPPEIWCRTSSKNVTCV